MTGLTGTRTLLAFHLRRDRLMLLGWIAGGVLLYYAQAVSVEGLYATQAEFDRAAAGMESNAAFIAMAGPPRVLNTIGGQVAWQASAFGAIVAGLMSMFLVNRHTRAEEESGRDELVRSAVVGRHAPHMAAVLVVLLANALLGVLIAGSLMTYGLAAGGSVALGLAAGLAGLVFGAIALVAVQLTQGSRAALAITGAALGVSYLLRAVGDIGDGTLSWLSPIGWGQAMRPYAGEIWWPALLSVVAVAVLGAVAVALLERRDIGSGMLSARPGPARGSSAMGSPLGLAWRLQRGTLVGWAAGLFLAGLAFGSIGKDVGDLIGDSAFSQDVFGQGAAPVVDSFYGTTAVMLGLLGTGFAISSVLRLRSEEAEQHTELVLAAGVPRWQWAASHLVITATGTLAVVALCGIGLGLGFGLVTGDYSPSPGLLAATTQYTVPALVIAAIGWVGYGLGARWAAIAWAALAFCLVVMLFGELLSLPSTLMDVSPFRHLALVPADAFRPVPVIVLAVVALGLGAAGHLALRRRDIV